VAVHGAIVRSPIVALLATYRIDHAVATVRIELATGVAAATLIVGVLRTIVALFPSLRVDDLVAANGQLAIGLACCRLVTIVACLAEQWRVDAVTARASAARTTTVNPSFVLVFDEVTAMGGDTNFHIYAVAELRSNLHALQRRGRLLAFSFIVARAFARSARCGSGAPGDQAALPH
jgi:hypothetical protein